MARLVSARCPNCGGHVKLDPARDFVTCTYCGTSAFIEREGNPEPRRPVGTAVIVVPRTTAASPLLFVGIAGAVVLMTGLAGVISWLSANENPPSLPIPGIPGPTGASPKAGPSYNITDRRPLFADFDGDGTTDFVLSFSVYEGGTTKYAYGGFDGKSGKLAWKTADLGSALYQHSAALAGQRLLIASPTGELTAHALKDGSRQWTTALGDRAKRFCRDGNASLRVVLSDGRALGIDLATGKQGSASAKGSCSDTQRDDALSLPPSRTGFPVDSAGPEQVSWRCNSTTVTGSYNFFVPDPCPKHLGVRSSKFASMQARGIIQTSGGWGVTGTRPEGTPSPMVGYFAGGKLVWSAAVHPENPLAARQGEPGAMVANHHLVASYGSIQGSEEHAVGFALETGKRLWDVKLPWSASKLAGNDDAVAIVGRSGALVLSTRDGAVRFSLGRD